MATGVLGATEVIDAGGVSSLSSMVLMDLAVAAATPADILPPVVTLITPATSLQLTSSTALVIDVTDNSALRRSIIAVRFQALGLEELAHTGDRFSALYSVSSTRTAIAGGWRYSLVRAGGWPGDVVVDVYAIDTSGLEA
jgi:hypothetical protein